MRTRPVWIALLVAVGCGDAVEPEPVGTPVTVEVVSGHRVAEQIQATGELLAVEEANVAAEVGGRITALRVNEGAAVRAGEVVLEIDRERRQFERANAEAIVAGARSEIAQQSRELERIRSLHERQAASQSQLDAARTRLGTARAQLSAAEAQLGLADLALRDAGVSAPFDGLVARRFVSVGDYVSEGELLFDLVALDPIEVEFHLPERDSGRVAIGDEVAVRVAPFPEREFRATVHVVSPRIDPATRTLRVKARVDNASQMLRPGLFARVQLGVAVRDAVPMIPEQAILQRSDGSVAFVVGDGNRAERRNLHLGLIRDGLAEVVSGIDVGDRVIVRGGSRLVDGALVDLRRADGTPLEVLQVGDGSEVPVPSSVADNNPKPARSLP